MRVVALQLRLGDAEDFAHRGNPVGNISGQPGKGADLVAAHPEIVKFQVGQRLDFAEVVPTVEKGLDTVEHGRASRGRNCRQDARVLPELP